MQTESNGRVMTHFRRRRSVAHPDVLHYKLHAFGSKLKLRLKRNSMLMAPNLVTETHHRDGVVTTRPAAKNKFYLTELNNALRMFVTSLFSSTLVPKLRSFRPAPRSQLLDCGKFVFETDNKVLNILFLMPI